ncbi:hypothetical protein EDC04DRAFT_2516467, partial [Pisolithus marmoratus]
LRCRLYSASCCRPRQVMMLTRCASLSRNATCYPVAESMLQDAVLQLYVHNCQIAVHEGRHTYHYCIFFKWHCRLRANAMLDKFQGDVVVMKIGTQVSSVVNMHACDIAVANYIVSR